LLREAQRLGAVRVLTGHTASDRAETLLLQLARGSHRRGLASLPQERELGAGIPLVRPLLGFSRDDTGAICRHLALPIWPDSSNADPRFSRNRMRHEVLPVLEALHPGASRRLAATAERLAAELKTEQELLALALTALMPPAATPALTPPVRAAPSPARCPALQRQELVGQSRANQRRLLQLWISQRTGRPLASRPLEQLLQRLGRGQPPGALDLPAGWQLHWDRHTLHLDPPLQQP
ncbi:MAG: ATP-binding protein, partial [Cyanobacteriota bacterium]|nr:ATP-binding protein [Cyanobacteriota bacterium]